MILLVVLLRLIAPLPRSLWTAFSKVIKCFVYKGIQARLICLFAPWKRNYSQPLLGLAHVALPRQCYR